MSTSGTRVYVQKDGVVLHQHEGYKGLHGPWIGHTHGAAVKKLVKDLTLEQAQQYEEALAGKSFAFMWEQRKANEGTWVEQKRGLVPGTLKAERANKKRLTVEEELAELAAYDTGFTPGVTADQSK